MTCFDCLLLGMGLGGLILVLGFLVGERLRETLRHVIQHPWDYDTRRVRESLGDE